MLSLLQRVSCLFFKFKSFLGMETSIFYLNQKQT
jgi:hypothetical protein